MTSERYKSSNFLSFNAKWPNIYIFPSNALVLKWSLIVNNNTLKVKSLCKPNINSCSSSNDCIKAQEPYMVVLSFLLDIKAVRTIKNTKTFSEA